jgi:ATP-binding cassette, subfamily B, bacterial
MTKPISPITRLWNLLRAEKTDITAIYFFAILSGLIQLSLPIGIQAIIGFVLGGTMVASLVVLIIILVIAVLVVGIMQINQMQIIEKIQQKIFVQYAFAFADRLPRLDLKNVDAFYLPELVNRFFDTTNLQKGLSKILLDLPTAIIQVLLGLILLAFYHPTFILFGILLLAVLWLILYTTSSKGLQSSLDKSSHKYVVAGWLEEMGRLFKTFKFSSASGLHIQKADEKTLNYLKARTIHFNVLLLQYRTLVLFKVAITAAMLSVGVALLLNQQINIGQFVAAELIIITVIAAVEKIIMNLDSVYSILTALEKMSSLTDKPVEFGGHYALDDSNGISVETHHLSFGYESEKLIIEDVNFLAEPGANICISGLDGAGKTTLLKLLLGVYKDFSGLLLINKLPIGNYNLDNLRERTGILFPQENIFEGSLWENIAMGRKDVDKKYVGELIQRVGLQQFLSTLPLGYDTLLDPTGRRLPRNVIQKILLIRALAHQPKLLILEEPWQGIEEQYKNDIQNLLFELKNTTIIVATNDEKFGQLCDQRIFLTI